MRTSKDLVTKGISGVKPGKSPRGGTKATERGADNRIHSAGIHGTTKPSRGDSGSHDKRTRSHGSE